jgi:hypothetical protein
VRLLVNVPIPVPSEVLQFETVGFPEVFQHTPLAITSAPSSQVTIPPDIAFVWVIAEITDVDTTGGTGSFLQEVRQNVVKIIRMKTPEILNMVFVVTYLNLTNSI